MGAYYFFDGPNCLVKTSLVRGAGAAQWCPDAPSASIHYHVERWNKLFPSYKVPVPSFCRTSKDSGAPIWKPGDSKLPPTDNGGPVWKPAGEEPANPITGPAPEQPPAGCEPAMSVPGDDRTTSSNFSRTGSASSGGDYGSGVIDQLGQPLVVGMTPLATYAADGKPVFNYETEIDIVDQYSGAAVHKLHEGSGDGILCFHPPELQDYMLHGSGVNADSRWPTTLSEVTILLHNCTRADATTGDSTVTRLAFGNPLAGSVKPKDGVYFDYDPATGTLNIQHTDSSGADDSNGDIQWNGSSLVGAGSGDISSGSNLTSGRVVKATGNKQIDTPIDLSMQYITVDSADDTVQLLAGPSKRIEIRSPDKIYFDVNGTNEMIVEAGKVTIAGLLDPTGLELTPVAANPGGTAANTLWLDSGASNALKHGANTLINGSTGSTDNAILRANGTGGSTAQSSGATINDNGKLTTTGGRTVKYTENPGSVTLDDTYHYIAQTTSFSSQTLTLPALANVEVGREYVIKHSAGANTLTIARYGGSDTIDGATSDITVTSGKTTRIVCVGAGGGVVAWMTFGKDF